MPAVRPVPVRPVPVRAVPVRPVPVRPVPAVRSSRTADRWSLLPDRHPPMAGAEVEVDGHSHGEVDGNGEVDGEVDGDGDGEKEAYAVVRPWGRLADVRRARAVD